MISKLIKGSLFFIIVIGISFCFFYTPLGPPPDQATKIPVHFYPFSRCPLVKVSIDQSTFLLLVDLGSYYMMGLKKEVLEKIPSKKKTEKTTEYSDVKGNVYHSPGYLIPQIHIGEVDGSPFLAREEDPYFLTHGSSITPPGEKSISKLKKKRLSKVDGHLGLGTFAQHQWFFDFPHSRMYFSNEKNAYEEQIRHFIKTPFLAEILGVILLIETDQGTKRFLLDTGSTCTCLKRTTEVENILRTNKFIIGNTDYGPRSLFVFDLSHEIGDYDGILGIDFLRKIAFHLDFENKIAYFQPPKKSLSQRIFSLLKK